MERGLRLLAFSLLPLAPAPALSADSAYTRHNYEKCRLVSKDEVGHERRCDGFAGIVVNHHAEPDDATIDFGAEGSNEDWPYRQSFVFAGKTIEWRGERTRRGLVPYAAIVRYHMGESIMGPFRPELMIFRLEGRTRSCLAASVDGRGADANQKARDLADTFVRGFKCGRDKRRARPST